jgi:hypothetical protein
MPDIFVSPRHRPIPDQPDLPPRRPAFIEGGELPLRPPLVASDDAVNDHSLPLEPLDATTHPGEVLYNVDTPTMPTAPRRHVDEYSTILAATPPTSNPLASFAAKPVGTSFDSQIEGENVLLLLRQHLITQWKAVLTILFLIIVPFLVSVLPIYGVIPLKFSFLGTILWYLFVMGFTLEVFLNWFYNVYIITDERVVDVDFNSLLYKNISSAQLENVEDITSTTAGALGAIFNFGDIQIQTSAAVTQFDFKAVPQPERVTAFLNELLVEEKQEELEGRVR